MFSKMFFFSNNQIGHLPIPTGWVHIIHQTAVSSINKLPLNEETVKQNRGFYWCQFMVVMFHSVHNDNYNTTGNFGITNAGKY